VQPESSPEPRGAPKLANYWQEPLLWQVLKQLPYDWSSDAPLECADMQFCWQAVSLDEQLSTQSTSAEQSLSSEQAWIWLQQ
jgi:hypothetical protein